MYDGIKCVKADKAFTDVSVAVFVTAALVFAVIDMEYGNLIFSNQSVELPDHTVKIVHNIIARIMNMAGVEADTEPVVFRHAVIDRGKLLKAFADLGALSRHGF